MRSPATLYRDGGLHLTEGGERRLEDDLDVLGDAVPEILTKVSDRLIGRVVCDACGCLCLLDELCPGCTSRLATFRMPSP